MIEFVTILVLAFNGEGFDNDIMLGYPSRMECGNAMVPYHEQFEGKDPEYLGAFCLKTEALSQVPYPKLRNGEEIR